MGARQKTEASRQGESEMLERAYGVLKDQGPMRLSDLGWQLWGETTESPNRGSGSHGQNKFCRSAGKVVRRLEREGRAKWKSTPGCILWEAV